MSDTYRSAAVTPVSRIVRSTVPAATVAVRRFPTAGPADGSFARWP